MCYIKKFKNYFKGSYKSIRRPHAEEIAIAKAGSKAKGATTYVTLEPCFHSSKNGSCTDQILRSEFMKFLLLQILIKELIIKVLIN